MTAEAAPPEDIGAQVVAGLRWGFLAQIGGRALSVLSGIAIFRLVAPEQLGLFNVGIAVLAVLLTINDLGLDVALVRLGGVEHDRVRSGGNTLALLTSVVLCGGCLVAAQPVANLAGAPGAAPLVRALSLVVVLDGLAVPARAVLVRRMAQRQLAVGELVAVATTAIVGVGAAAAGARGWAPTVGTLAGGAVNAALMHRWSGLRRPALGDPRHAWPLVRIGSPIAATAALELALFAVTAVVVSRQLGPDALAFYVLAFNVSSWPAMVVTQAIRKVAVGAFAVMAGDEARTGRATRLGVSLLLLLAVPLAAVLAAAADPLLRTLYGGDAGVAATALAWLVVLGAARVLTGFLFDVLVSIGLERRVLVTQLLWVVVAVPAVWWGTAEAGITGAAAAHALVAIGVVLPSAVAHIQRVAAAGWAWWSTLAAVVAAGGLALVAAQPVVRLAGGSPVAIVAGGVTAVGVYLVALRLLGAHRLVRELRAGARQQLS